MAKLKAVFFDAAGTLFDTREPVGASYARIAHAFGVDTSAAAVNAAFRRAFHDAEPLAFGPDRDAQDLRRLERDWWRGLVAKTFAGFGEFSDFEAYFDALFEFFAAPVNWIADNDALSILQRLHECGLTLGVISNFDYRLYRILDGLELSRWFDSITISSEAGYAKPSARLFETALKRHRLAPDEALHVGDSERLDLAGASAAGLAAVLLDRRMGEHLAIEGRIARVSSLTAIIEAVRLVNAT